MILLSLSTSTIDARCGFGGVSTHEAESEGGYKSRKGKGEILRDRKRTLACRGGEHWHHAREEYVRRRDQQDHHRLR